MSEETPGKDSREYRGQWWSQEPRHHWEAFRCKQFTATSRPNKALLQPTPCGSPQLSSWQTWVWCPKKCMIQFFCFCFFSEILEQCFSDLLKQAVTTLPWNNQRANECDSSWWEPWPRLWASPRVLIWASQAGALELLDLKAPSPCTSHLGLEEHEVLACHKDRVAGPLLVLSRLLRKGLRGRIWATAVLWGGGGWTRGYWCVCLHSQAQTTFQNLPCWTPLDNG